MGVWNGGVKNEVGVKEAVHERARRGVPQALREREADRLRV